MDAENQSEMQCAGLLLIDDKVLYCGTTVFIQERAYRASYTAFASPCVFLSSKCKESTDEKTSNTAAEY